VSFCPGRDVGGRQPPSFPLARMAIR
jgi:hypothetical protein